MRKILSKVLLIIIILLCVFILLFAYLFFFTDWYHEPVGMGLNAKIKVLDNYKTLFKVNDFIALNHGFYCEKSFDYSDDILFEKTGKNGKVCNFSLYVNEENTTNLELIFKESEHCFESCKYNKSDLHFYLNNQEIKRDGEFWSIPLSEYVGNNILNGSLYWEQSSILDFLFKDAPEVEFEITINWLSKDEFYRMRKEKLNDLGIIEDINQKENF